MLQEALLAMQKANAIRRITAELTLVRMCDERLSSSPEAMLARIASIESGIATGKLAVQEVSPEVAPIAEQAPKKARRAHAPTLEDDDDMFRGDAPSMAAVPPKESAPTPAVRKSTPRQAPAESGSVRVLKPFRNRAEVLEKMEAASAMLASFFKRAKWYTEDGGKIVLKFENQFDLDNMKFFDGEALFVRIASAVIGRALTKADLVCECEAQKKTDSVIDKILEAAEE
jgi:hypothetical protein